jgi:hypothetical protein
MHFFMKYIMIEILLVKYAFNRPYERKINGSYQMQREHPTDAFFEQWNKETSTVTPLWMMTAKKAVDHHLECVITLFLLEQSSIVIPELRRKASHILDRFVETYMSELIALTPQFRLLLREDTENVSIQKKILRSILKISNSYCEFSILKYDKESNRNFIYSHIILYNNNNNNNKRF